MSWRLALRYLGERKLRTALTTLAIVLGVMLIFGLNSWLPAMQAAFRNNLMAAANLTDLTVTAATRGTFGAGAVDTVAGTPGVARATGSLVRAVVLPPDEVLTPKTGQVGQPISSLILVGIDPAASGQIRPLTVAAGRLLEVSDAAAQVVLIGQTLADQTGLAVGDTLGLPSATGRADFQIVGVVSTPPLPGAEEVYVPLGAAQRLLNLPGLINTVEAMFAPGADAATVRQAVLDRLGAGFKLGANEVGGELAAYLNLVSYVFLLFGVVALGMGAFIIFITFRTSVVERRRDIGMLRSLGASRRTILGLVLTESVVQGVAGTIIGMALGYALVLGLTAAVGPLLESMLRFKLPSPVPTAGNYALAIGLGVGFTVLGAVLPAVSAGRLTPLEAMTPPRPEVETVAARKRAIGGAVLAVLSLAGLFSGNLGLSALGAVLFLTALVWAGPALVSPISRVFGRLLGAVFAREGRIAESNLARQPSRASLTASAMMIGLAVLVALGGVSTSLIAGVWKYMDESVGSSDYVLLPQSLVLGGGNVGAGPELLGAIRATPGVAEATSLRLATTVVEGLPASGKLGGGAAGAGAPADIQLVGIDPVLYPKLGGLNFSKGDPTAAYTALAAGRGIIVNNIFAVTNGVKVGQDLQVLTAAGPRAYRVVGVGSDFLNVKLATGFVSQTSLRQDLSETSDLMILAGRAAGADPALVTTALQGIAKAYPAFSLFETNEWRDTLQAQIGSIGSIFYVLMFLLAFPSLIALVNTLGINVIERTREIGVLRSVGATRRQVGRIILAESLLLAAAGTAYGILAGLWLGYVLVGAMASLVNYAYSFPYAGILAGVAVGLLFGVVAAWLPARSAARLNVVTALQYE